MDLLLARLIFALSVNELVHNSFEIWGMRQKVGWLKARIENRGHGRWPININSKFKTIVVHASLLLLVTGCVILTSAWLGIEAGMLIKLSITMLIISYIITTIKVDRYHNEIGSLLKRFKSSK